jgi:predicted dehydrogenase
MDEAISVIRRSRHLSLGFPVSDFTDQAECLVKLAQEARVQVQVGHSERHRLVFRSSLAHISHPQHIRLTHHLPEFLSEDNPQQIFHEILADLDLVLGLTGSQAKKVRTHAAFLTSGKLFQIDARIEFHNGSVISLTVRQGLGGTIREIEVLQESGLVLIDLAGGRSSSKSPGNKGWTVHQLWPLVESVDPGISVDLQKDEDTARQCINFIHALQLGKRPLSDLEEGYAALEITRQIESSVGRF